jgi:hypothetical protein
MKKFIAHFVLFAALFGAASATLTKGQLDFPAPPPLPPVPGVSR